MLRSIALTLALAASALAADTLEAFGYKWSVPIGSEWKFEDGVLRMLVARPSTQPRRPAQHAIALTPPFEQVTLEADVKRDKGSLILLYAWRDENHFNYAHLSVDAPSKQPVHNGIFHVFGGDRVRISNLEGEGSLPTEEWTPVKLEYSSETHKVNVTVGGKQFPSLIGVDLSLGAGRVGIGSFFETAQFRNVRIKGK